MQSHAVAKPTVRTLGPLCMGSNDSFCRIPNKKQTNGKLRIISCIKHDVKKSYCNVVTKSYFNVETTSYSTLKQRQISTLKQHQISTLKQLHISTLIRFNKIVCFVSVDVRRCFNIVSTSICLLGYIFTITCGRVFCRVFSIVLI